MAEQTITIPEGFELQKVNDSEYRIVKKEMGLPNSWEEFCENYPLKEGETWINSFSKTEKVEDSIGKERTKDWFNLLPNKEYAEAILALIQLIQLRDCYRQGWKPDWNSSSYKYGIGFNYNMANVIDTVNHQNIFSFQSREIRNKFSNNFKDLIEKTKPLFE